MIFECPNAPTPCNCENAPASCSPSTKDNYDIANKYTIRSRAKTVPLGRGREILELKFGWKPKRRSRRSRRSRSCTDYKVGVGPYAVTKKMQVNKGDVMSFTFKANGRFSRSRRNGDNYEMFAGLYMVPVAHPDIALAQSAEGKALHSMGEGTLGSDELVVYRFQRGKKQRWTNHKITAPETGMYYFKFMLAAYDRTNSGYIGAVMSIKNVQVKPSPTGR